MMRSKHVAVAVMLAITAPFLAACGEPEPEQPEHSEVCIDENEIIRPPEDCEQGRSQHGFVYVPQSTRVGSHGSKLASGYATMKPAGTIGRAPSSGGFGTHSGTSGS